MSSPTEDETPRERLARLMDERRADLELNWQEVADTAGLTREGLRKIRYGTRAMQTDSKVGLERALRWKRGSVNAILAGGDPTPVEPAPEDQRPALSPVPEVPDERLDHLEKVADRVADGLAELRQGLQELREERLRKAH